MNATTPPLPLADLDAVERAVRAVHDETGEPAPTVAILERMLADGHHITDNALRRRLQLLHARGAVERRRDNGRAHLYQPADPIPTLVEVVVWYVVAHEPATYDDILRHADVAPRKVNRALAAAIEAQRVVRVDDMLFIRGPKQPPSDREILDAPLRRTLARFNRGHSLARRPGGGWVWTTTGMQGPPDGIVARLRDLGLIEDIRGRLHVTEKGQAQVDD